VSFLSVSTMRDLGANRVERNFPLLLSNGLRTPLQVSLTKTLRWQNIARSRRMRSGLYCPRMRHHVRVPKLPRLSADHEKSISMISSLYDHFRFCFMKVPVMAILEFQYVEERIPSTQWLIGHKFTINWKFGMRID
jgi:hypothetical protein